MNDPLVIWPSSVLLRASIGSVGTDPLPSGHLVAEFQVADHPTRVIARNSFEYDPSDSPSLLIATFNHLLLVDPVQVGLVLRPECRRSDAAELRGLLVALLPAEMGDGDIEDYSPWRSSVPDWAREATPVSLLTLGEMYRGSRVHPEDIDLELRHWLDRILVGRTLPIEDYHLHRALGDLPEGFP